MTTLFSIPSHEGTSKIIQPSHLLTLPAELRNQIYTLLLGRKSISLSTHRANDFTAKGEIATAHYPPRSGRTSTHAQPDVLTLLLVCKQIYTEARHLIFSANVFRYSDTVPNVQVWAEQRPDALARIEALRMYSSGMNPERQWLSGLKFFPGLKKIKVAFSGSGKQLKTAERGPWGARTLWDREFEEGACKAAGGKVKVEFWVTFQGLEQGFGLYDDAKEEKRVQRSSTAVVGESARDREEGGGEPVV